MRRTSCSIGRAINALTHEMVGVITAAWDSDADRLNPETAARMFYEGGKGGQKGLVQVPGFRPCHSRERPKRYRPVRSPTPSPMGTPRATDRRQPGRAVRHLLHRGRLHRRRHPRLQRGRLPCSFSAPPTAGRWEASPDQATESARAAQQSASTAPPGPVRLPPGQPAVGSRRATPAMHPIASPSAFTAWVEQHLLPHPTEGLGSADLAVSTGTPVARAPSPSLGYRDTPTRAPALSSFRRQCERFERSARSA